MKNPPRDLLQWGRELTLAEMLLPLMPGLGQPGLQWGRELTLAEISNGRKKGARKKCFNGAAS